MIAAHDVLIFTAACLLMVLTPGPNMIYLISRSICQGRRAGLISLCGVIAGFLVHLFAAAAGLSALFLAIPLAYEALKWAGAIYLAYLAWQCLRPGGQPIFAVRAMPQEPVVRLFSVGFATAALNPKVALFYVAVLPPFIDPARGDVFTQGAILGAVQIAVAIVFDGALVMGAAGVARFLGTRPGWMAAQRWILGGALGLLAVRLAAEGRR